MHVLRSCKFVLFQFYFSFISHVRAASLTNLTPSLIADLSPYRTGCYKLILFTLYGGPGLQQQCDDATYIILISTT